MWATAIMRQAGHVALIMLLSTATSWSTCRAGEPATLQHRARMQSGTVARIEFAGLRRIRDAALWPHVTSRAGFSPDSRRIETDVRALNQLGWFEWVCAEVEPLSLQPTAEQANAEKLQVPLLRLIFRVQERPLLAGVGFRGSRALAPEQVTALLTENKVAIRIASPVDRFELQRAGRLIKAELADRGFPNASVRVLLEPVPTAAVKAVLEIEDGPQIRVADVSFKGNAAFSAKALRRQMKRVTPHAWFAGLRGKTIYTPTRLEEDLERLAQHYHNHGYPEARLGAPQVRQEEQSVRRWQPWPRRVKTQRFRISIPIEEGSLYALQSVDVRNERLAATPAQAEAVKAALQEWKAGEVFSQRKIEQARKGLYGLRALRPAKGGLPLEVEASSQLDPATRTARVTFHIGEVRPYTVRSIEFTGHRRFSDRYYRRRILLREGDLFNPATLELGLARLASTGFIRPVRPQDVDVRVNEAQSSADISIRVEEIGRQRLSLTGGQALATGSTLGVAYNVFDLLGGEELLTGHLEGGPESLQIAVSLAKEALFGTRASLGLSLYRNVVRRALPAGGSSGPLFRSRSAGIGVNWSHPVSAQDSLTIAYQLSRTTTQYNLALPPELAGRVDPLLRIRRTSRALGLNWTHGGERRRVGADVSYSGGWLRGDLNLLRSSVEYTHFARDPLSHGHNTWGFRAYLAGVGSHQGPLLLESRLYPGEELVRGFRTGEIGPYAVVNPEPTNQPPTYQAQNLGATLVTAANLEYRTSLLPRTQGAAFFDVGAGWMVFPWVGPGRPSLLERTDGLLRASTGYELRYELPVVQQVVRVYYALNPLRLARVYALPDGSVFRPSERRSAVGWGLGLLF